MERIITHEMVKDEKGNIGIKCLACGLTSWYSEDVKYKWCEFCHQISITSMG